MLTLYSFHCFAQRANLGSGLSLHPSIILGMPAIKSLHLIAKGDLGSGLPLLGVSPNLTGYHARVSLRAAH